MIRPSNAANFVTPQSYESRQLMSDEDRAALGRAQIAAGDYIEGEELKAFLDSLTVPADQD